VKYASAAAFRRALETRLLALSRDGSLSLVRLRKSVAFDRLLARLFAVAPDRWVLKGGLALDYRLGAKARTTMDIDLAGPGGEDAATADLLATGELDLGDHFSFAIERTAKLDQLVEGPPSGTTCELTLAAACSRSSSSTWGSTSPSRAVRGHGSRARQRQVPNATTIRTKWH